MTEGLPSAVELARRLRARELSAAEALAWSRARIEAVNPALNAVVATRWEQAKAEAAAADQRLRAGDPSPLLGLPYTVKEFVAVRGMPQTAGILARSGVVAAADATVTARLARAGAVCVGVTNTPEGGLWHETNNRVWGRTNNPHDLRRTPGGSTGGEGAIVAAGGSAFGIGSDTGGSIRIPASFCGIAGHKPTSRLVPTTGHFPLPPGGPADCPMAIGPLARAVDDLWLVLQAIAGPDGVDPKCDRVLEGGSLDDVDWRGVTVYAVASTSRVRVDPEVEAAVHSSAAALRERGATLAPWTGPDLAGAFTAWAALLGAGNESYERIVELRRPLLRELASWSVGRGRHTGGVLAILLLERSVGRFLGTSQRAGAARQLREAFDLALGPRGILVHPAYPVPAPVHRRIGLRSPLDAGCTTGFNVTESPVTVVRARTHRSGLPIGVQLVGPRGGDRLTLAAGKALEAVFGVPSPVYPRFLQAS